MACFGFYEGEGSCGCYSIKSKKIYKYNVLTVSISQKEKRVIKWIRTILGFGSINKITKSGINKITMWRWKATNKNARKFLMSIKPFMRHPGKILQLESALSKDRKTVNPNYQKVGRK